MGLTIALILSLFGGSNAQASRHVEIISFEREFQEYLTATKDLPASNPLVLWDKIIEGPHQKFYAQGVWEKQSRPNWLDRKNKLLPPRLDLYKTIAPDINKQFASFKTTVEQQVHRLTGILPNFVPDFPIYAVLAPNFDAKSVILDKNSVGLAVALDSIVIEKADYNILFPHEFFHAYHAKHSGFLNDGVMPNTSIAVPLWEEGLATYISGLVNDGSKDTALLFDKAFETLRAEDTKWLAQKFISVMKLKTLEPGPTDTFKTWFSMGVPKLKDGLPNRCGYYLGLKVVREIAKTHSLKEMVQWRPNEIEKPVAGALIALSK